LNQKNQQQPKLRPSQRPKKRYILFTFKGGFDELKKPVQEIRKQHYLKLIEFNPEKGQGIARCNREKLSAVRKQLNALGVKTLKTSGTVKALRQNN